MPLAVIATAINKNVFQIWHQIGRTKARLRSSGDARPRPGATLFLQSNCVLSRHLRRRVEARRRHR